MSSICQLLVNGWAHPPRNVDTNIENYSGKEGYKDHKLLSSVSTSVSSAELVSEAGCMECGLRDLVLPFGNGLRFNLGSGGFGLSALRRIL